jgi:hypothetical protein
VSEGVIVALIGAAGVIFSAAIAGIAAIISARIDKGKQAVGRRAARRKR